MLYFPLSPRTRQIRLICLHSGSFDDPITCDFIHIDLNRYHSAQHNLPSFEALSYTWGDPNQLVSIRLKNQDFKVTKNLEQALRHLRPLIRHGTDDSGPGRYLWIHAICVNQQDLRERSEQVVRMPEIYKAAQLTVIWLGASTTESDKAMDFMDQYWEAALDMRTDLLQARSYREEYVALVRGLLVRPWWQRVWIVQEVAVSNQLVVVCGTKKTSWRVLNHFAYIVHEYHSPAVSEVLRTISKDEIRDSNLGVRLSWIRNTWDEVERPSLALLVVEFRSWCASLPVDKIFGLLGMAQESSDPAMKPNYKETPQKLFRTTTKLIIERQDKLDFMVLAEGVRYLEGLPSWTPDFTVPNGEVADPLKGRTRLWEKCLYSAAGDSSMAVSFSSDDRIMYVKGIEADSVHSLAAYWDTNIPTLEGLRQVSTTLLATFREAMEPAAAAITARYGSTSALSLAMGKLLTADRVVNAQWDVSRHEEGESWLDLPIEPPEGYTDKGDPDAQQNLWDRARKHMLDGTLSERRFFVTKLGHIGLAPKHAEIGDLICVLFGCDTPLVLRPIGDHYIFKGECFVHGLMDGELMNCLRDGTAKEKCFEIW